MTNCLARIVGGALLCWAMAWDQEAHGVVSRSSPKGHDDGSDAHVFPITPFVGQQVAFWERIFAKYPTTSTLIHDVDLPDRVVDLIDFKEIIKNFPGNDARRRADRDRVARKYLDRYGLALRRFKEMGDGALRFGAIEKRVYAVYSRTPSLLPRLFKGQVQLRHQAGLSDTFIEALARARPLLPHMEETFRNAGLPTTLTRLPFVESMFNLHALSKVGASGIWQFMPGTARRFIFVNRMTDERNSPLKATKGAALLLADNYSELKSWPLAITAYNHGTGGMSKAVDRVRSRDLDAIITRYESPSFQFASKNFYAEFLAAKRVYAHLTGNERTSSRDRLDVVPIKIDKRINVAQLLSIVPVDQKKMQQLNPCLRSEAFSRYRYVPLPKNYEIFVPRGTEDRVRASLRSMKVQSYAQND